MLLCDAVRDRGGLGGGVPMFARALNEFMLCPEPYTGRLCCLGIVEVAGETVG